MIAFIGLSHLGIVCSAATAAKGFDVLAFDPDDSLPAALRDGQLPVAEPGLAELLVSHKARLQFTSDPAGLRNCDLLFYSLDIPTDTANRSDLDPLRRLIDLTAPHVAPTATMVVLCQVPPGFTRPLAAQKRSGSVFYQVETLIFGNAVERAMRPERFIIGCADPAAARPPAYARWLESFGCPVLPMRYESAELAKISINLFLVSSVTTTNTLAEICERTGADWSEIEPALRLDRRIGPHAYLTPGLGIAGGNLERDLVTAQELAAEHGSEAGVVSAWQRNSRHRRDWALRKVHELVLAKLAQPRLAIWGLAYKPGTNSVKNSPSLALAAALTSFEKRAYDPLVPTLDPPVPKLTLAKGALEACRGADALIVMTPWSEFSAIDIRALRKEMAGKVLIDPFGALDSAACREAGFSHHRLGH